MRLPRPLVRRVAASTPLVAALGAALGASLLAGCSLADAVGPAAAGEVVVYLEMPAQRVVADAQGQHLQVRQMAVVLSAPMIADQAVTCTPSVCRTPEWVASGPVVLRPGEAVKVATFRGVARVPAWITATVAPVATRNGLLAPGTSMAVSGYFNTLAADSAQRNGAFVAALPWSFRWSGTLEGGASLSAEGTRLRLVVDPTALFYDGGARRLLGQATLLGAAVDPEAALLRARWDSPPAKTHWVERF